MTDALLATLLGIRLLLAVTFLGIPFSSTLHGFNVVSVVAVIIGSLLLVSVVRSVVRFRRTA